MACNPISVFLPGCSPHILSPFLFLFLFSLFWSWRWDIPFLHLLIFLFFLFHMWYLAGSVVNIDIHFSDMEPGVDSILRPLVNHHGFKSGLRFYFPFCPREARLVLSLKIFFFDSLFPFILFIGHPNPSFCCYFPFFCVWLIFLSFFKAGYPALVVNPVYNFLCSTSFPWSRVLHSWEQWTTRRQWTRGEWQGTRIIMSLLMCHAGSVIGS